MIVPVDDQDEALEFYMGTLGFEKRLDGAFGEDSGGSRWRRRAPDDDRARAARERAGRHRGELRHRDADADHAALRGRGVDADAELIRMGDGVPPMFTFRDPDGNRFRMVERD